MGDILDGLKIEVEYCECGCHGTTITCGPFMYWMYSFDRKIVEVHKGHGWTAPMIAQYPCSSGWIYTEAEAAVKKMIMEDVRVMFLTKVSNRSEK